MDLANLTAREFERARLRALIAKLNCIADAEHMDGLRFFGHEADEGWYSLRLGAALLSSENPDRIMHENIPDQKPTIPDQSKPTKPPRLSKLDRLILSKLKAGGQTMNRLANLCDHYSDQHFRTRVRRLVTLGMAVHDEPYWSLVETDHGQTTKPATAG